MKNFLRILPFALCAFAGATFADDFTSMVIPGGVIAQPLPRVHGDQFMVIRNFTQENGTTHGVVMVTQLPGTTAVNVLAAAILNMSPPDVINSVVIAGPADVSVTCGATTGMNCFISFKKDSN
jgi:hypothetical protein